MSTKYLMEPSLNELMHKNKKATPSSCRATHMDNGYDMIFNLGLGNNLSDTILQTKIPRALPQNFLN